MGMPRTSPRQVSDTAAPAMIARTRAQEERRATPTVAVIVRGE
jgi:hypothetical protein